MKKLWIVLTLVLSGFVFADVDSIDSLKGINEIAVVVDAFTPEQIRLGLNPVEISERIAKTLMDYNISPVSADNLPDAPHTPVLWLSVSSSFSGEVVAVNFELSVRQDVQLARDENIEVVKAITWSRNSIGLMPPRALPQGVDIKIREFLRSFIEDHHDANGLDSPFGKRGMDV